MKLFGTRQRTRAGGIRPPARVRCRVPLPRGRGTGGIIAELARPSLPILTDVNRCAYTVSLAALALAGCASPRWATPPTALARAEVARRVAFAAPADPDPATPDYRLACPDLLELRFADKPEWDCLSSVAADGTAGVGPTNRVAVQGKTVAEVRAAVAAALRLDPAGVTVRVADPRAGTVELYGPEQKRHRVMPYRGPETVVEFLARSGAMKPGSFDPRDVTVLRPNVAAGQPAEVFRVDLEAILLDGDVATNLVVAAGDQVYVGESRRSSFARLLPTRLKPVYGRIMGVVPDGWPWVSFARRPGSLLADD